MKKYLVIVFAAAIGIGVFRVPILKAVTASYQSTIRVVSSTGVVLDGVASAVTANYNQTVRIVDSTNHVIDSFGAGSTTQGIGGGVTNTLGADSIANVKNFGAKANGIISFDGAMPAGPTRVQTSTSSPAAPAYTTQNNNDLVVSVFAFDTSFTWSSKPSVTNAIDVASGGTSTGLWIGSQTKTTAGLVSAVSGTLAGGEQTYTETIPFMPAAGQTITVGNATSAAQAASTSYNVTAPAGIANGDIILGCISFFNGNNRSGIVTWPSGTWTTLFSDFATGTRQGLLCKYKVAASEPGTYSFRGSQGFSASAIIDLKNVNTTTVIDSALTSASASFSSADVGKLVCAATANQIASTTTNTGQSCGTIGAVTSSTAIVPSFPNYNSNNSGGAALSGAEIRYATDDKAAIQSAINALTNGGTVFLPQGYYGVSDGLTFPANISINLMGVGASFPEWWSTAQSGVGPTNAPFKTLATTLMYLSTSMTGGALQFNQTVVNQFSQLANDTISHLTLWGGAGQGYDGGGTTATAGYVAAGPADGVDILGYSHVTLDGVWIGNFAGDGVFIDYPHLLGGTSYSVHDRIENGYITLNGQNGIGIGLSKTDAAFIEGVVIENNEVEANWLNGLDTNGTEIIGLEAFGNVFQWNNRSNTNPGYEVVLHTNSNGVFIHGNYFESNANGATTALQVNDGGTGSVTGPAIIGNWFFENGGGTTAIGWGFDGSHVVLGGLVSGNRFTSGWTNCITRQSSHSTGLANDCNGTNIAWNDTGAVTWAGSSNAVVSNSAANFFPAIGVDAPVASTLEGDVSTIAASPATISNLKCVLTTAAGVVTVAGGTSYVLALRQNIATSALTCTIATAASSCVDTTHSVTVATGDQLDYIVTPSGTPTALVAKCSVLAN